MDNNSYLRFDRFLDIITKAGLLLHFMGTYAEGRSLVDRQMSLVTNYPIS